MPMKNREIRGNIFLYRRIQAHLEHLMRQGVLKVDEKIPGERVLSQQLNVSRDTVRAALRALEEQEYLVRIPAKGTFIRRKAAEKEFKIAFVFPEPEISLLYQEYGNYASNSEIWRGIVAKCAELGGTVSFFPARPHPDEAEARKLADQLTAEYAGVIFPSNEFDAAAEYLIEAGFPCVFACQHSRFPYVFYDREQAIARAARHLLDNDCRSIVLLGCPGNTWEQKIAGIRREFAEREIEIPDADVVTVTDRKEQLFHEIERIFRERGELPDAVFCATPILSFALLHLAAAEHWDIPGRIRIFGYANNMDQQRTIPELTHIRLPHAAIGAKAVGLIAAKLRRGAKIPPRTLLSAELIQGETTMPAADREQNDLCVN